MSLTVALITGRRDAKFEWLFESLRRQRGFDRVTQIVVVDFYAQSCDDWTNTDVVLRHTQVLNAAGKLRPLIQHAPPKPTIWQGPHRVTKGNWWANSNARNTAIALCRNEWIALCDDRCVLQPGWMQAVKAAMKKQYIVFGSYQKRHNLVVNSGIIQDMGALSGMDNRDEIAKGKVVKATGQWAYGCTFAMPVEWALEVNGVPEQADGMSFEDILFGMILQNNGFPMRYDPSMRMIQDRTPSELDKPFRREDKGVSPNDKSHASLVQIGGMKRSAHDWELRQVRADVLAGKPFPVPSNPDPCDWYDNEPIRGL